MTITFLILANLLIMQESADQVEPSPLVLFDSETLQLGNVEPGVETEGAFRLRNNTDKVVQVELLARTYRCRFPEESALFTQHSTQGVLEPGADTHIVFWVTVMEQGPFREYLLVKFTCEGREQVNRLYVEATGKQLMRITPDPLDFDLAAHPEITEKDVKIESTGSAPLEIQEVWAEPAYVELHPKGGDDFILKLTDELFQTPGRNVETTLNIAFKYRDRLLKSLIPIKITIPNPCDIKPDPVLFGRISEARHRVQRVLLECQDGFVLPGVAKAPDYLDIRFAPRPDGHSYVVLLYLNKRPPDDTIQEDVLFNTGEEGRYLKIRISGKVETWPEDTQEPKGE